MRLLVVLGILVASLHLAALPASADEPAVDRAAHVARSIEAVPDPARAAQRPMHERAVAQGPAARGLALLLSSGVDLEGGRTRRDGGFAVQVRPKGPGAVVRAVYRF